MAFTNERDKKGRLSFVYNSDDSGETIREIVEDCQKKVVGKPDAREAHSRRPSRDAAGWRVLTSVRGSALAPAARQP